MFMTLVLLILLFVGQLFKLSTNTFICLSCWGLSQKTNSSNLPLLLKCSRHFIHLFLMFLVSVLLIHEAFNTLTFVFFPVHDIISQILRYYRFLKNKVVIYTLQITCQSSLQAVLFESHADIGSLVVIWHKFLCWSKHFHKKLLSSNVDRFESHYGNYSFQFVFNVECYLIFSSSFYSYECWSTLWMYLSWICQCVMIMTSLCARYVHIKYWFQSFCFNKVSEFKTNKRTWYIWYFLISIKV